MSVARLHHYVPRCYLKGFASGSGRYQQTHVVDVIDKRTFQTSIKNVCAIRDFNTVDLPGHPPDVLEQQLSKFDSQVGSALKTIGTARSLEDEEARLVLLNFASTVATRNPFFRSQMEAAIEHTHRIIADMMVSTRERFEAQLAAARRAGQLPADLEADYEEVREFVRKDEYEISFPNGFHVSRELKVQDTVLRTMLARKWALLRAPPRSEFVTSDLPVCLWPNFPTSRPVGHAVNNTTVVLPLTASLAMMGTFDGREGAFDVPREYVASLNLAVALRCDRHVYAKTLRFETADVDGTVTVGPDLMYRVIASTRPPSGRKRSGPTRSSDKSSPEGQP